MGWLGDVSVVQFWFGLGFGIIVMGTNKLKIAFVEPVGAHGGLEVYDLGACSALVANDCVVELYTSEKTRDLVEASGLRVLKYFGKMYDKNISILRRFFIFLVGLIRVRCRQRLFKPDIVYAHIFTFSFQELCVFCVLLTCRARLFINVHDPITFGNSSSAFIKYIFSKLLSLKRVRVTTHTKYSRSVMNDVFPRINVAVMPYSDIDFINSARGGTPECKNYLGLSARYRYVLFFGQIKKTKGLDVLIRAWQVVASEIPDIKLLIVGRCWHDEAELYRALILSMGLNDRVEWVEKYIDDQDVPSYFKASELVVLPYTRIYSSAVLVRSIGYGTPFIISDEAAFVEVAGSNQPAAVFESGDVGGLAKRLVCALTNRELLFQMRENTALLSSGRFSWDAVGCEMKSVFELDSDRF